MDNGEYERSLSENCRYQCLMVKMKLTNRNLVRLGMRRKGLGSKEQQTEHQ
jgi:hypothetical protein